VPHAELETWLVQREPDPLPMECPDQPSLVERAPTGVHRERSGPSVEPRAERGTLQEEMEEDNIEVPRSALGSTDGPLRSLCTPVGALSTREGWSGHSMGRGSGSLWTSHVSSSA
ncbi:nuclear factor erythroid 2-related factor 1-like protein, partial [Lates japonicus]